MNATRPAARAPAGFNLTRQFSILSLACVVVVAGVLGQTLARMLSDRLLHRDAVVTMEFVQSIVRTDETAHYFTGADPTAVPAPLEDTLLHFAKMPDVLRANVYSLDRRAIWSSDRNIAGRQFGPNEELDRSLAGTLMYKSGPMSKEEHVAGSSPIESSGGGYFVEIYVPVRDAAGHVVGVVELYKTPNALFEAIAEGQRTVAIGAALGGLLLYAALIGIVRRADAVMRDQQRRLVEGERLAAVGEMAAAVAHSIRNPLASIRTSVEDALDRDPGRFREPAEDIVAAVDKMEEWVRELLSFSSPGSLGREALDLNALVGAAIEASAREMQRRGVRPAVNLAQPTPPAQGDAAMVGHVLQSLITNALDAMPRGGELEVTTRVAERAEIVIRDHGEGIAPEQMENVFKPFFTTKARGVGLGLPLARRMVERMGGELSLESRRGGGTTVRIALPG
jgi:signal transduction histidine kinase